MEQNNRRYFQSLDELSQPESVAQKEFAPNTPGKDIVDEGDFDLKSSRRDFLKFMGFGISAATLAACTKTPIKKAIPYVIKPDEVDPGIPNYYASFYGFGGYGVMVKTREGRPIKIEGNNHCPLSQGGTSAAGQAAVLSLYDEGRLKTPLIDGKEATWDDIDKDLYKGLRGITKKGGKIAILSNSVNSPSTLRAIADFKNAHPSTEHVQYDAVSYNGIRQAHKRMFGKAMVPSYDFSKAKTIVSFGADFLGTWLTPVPFTKQYSKTRNVSRNEEMSYHVQFESQMTLAGGKADLRIPTKPSEQGAAMVALYNALAKKAGKSTLSKPGKFNKHISEEKISHVADELWSTRKSGSMVVCGSNDKHEQLICASINNLLGAYGKTIDTNKELKLFNGDDQAVNKLVSEMNAGQIDALIIYGANPVYTFAGASKFKEGLKKVGLSVSLSPRLDETSQLVKYVAPDSHWLESWNDFNPVEGQYNISQPTIAPIFDTRQGQESILTWGKAKADFYDYVRATWQKAFQGQTEFATFDDFWKHAVHDGVYVSGRSFSKQANILYSNANSAESTASKSTTETTSETVSDTITTNEKVGLFAAAGSVVKGESSVKDAIKDLKNGRDNQQVVEKQVSKTTTSSNASQTAMVGGIASTMSSRNVDLTTVSSTLIARKNNASGTELSLYQKVGTMAGEEPNNPWLIEMPDAVSKVSWDNYLCVSPVYAEEQGWKDGDLVTIKANGTSLEKVPVLLMPGQLSGTVSIALGYGRKLEEKAGRVCNGVGVDVYPLVSNDKDFNYTLTGVSLEKTGSGYELAKTQTHHHIQIPTGLQKQDRASDAQRKGDIVKETSLGTLVAYRNNKGEHNGDSHGHGGHGKDDVSKVYESSSAKPDKYKELNIYPSWKEENNFYKALHWGMTVNLNTCTGCNACVIACQSENNIPVVGKEEVMRRREMHWIRIDRYFATTDRKEEDRSLVYTDNPSVMFQPLMCQHCDNAPCENVCPVNAINHSSEGINQQIYNRCMGTRYCANNCPYKVRRFNWFAYYDNEEFNYNFTMNSGLGRMVLNPDVTVRARGVMEKCNFCTQRIQAAKLEAKAENRSMVDGDVKTACQTACPADAITFGNMNDPEAEVSKVIKGDLSYRLVELLNTNNSVYYTTQVRNIKLESEMPVGMGGNEAHEENHGHAEEAHS